jgi:hypothetical protein
MRDGIESHVRRVVARHLGVSPRTLAPDVWLQDELAGDRDTVQSLVLAVERRLGIRLDARVLDEVRSYGELVAATLEAIRVRRAELHQESGEIPSGRIRVVGRQDPPVERAGVLTPYLLESVCDDARRAGPGATLDVCLADGTTDEQIACLRERLAVLGRHGVTVNLSRRTEPQRNVRKGA